MDRYGRQVHYTFTNINVNGTNYVRLTTAKTRTARRARFPTQTRIATSSDEYKIKRLNAMGVNKIVNHKQTPEWDKEVLAINGGKNVDHVIEVGGSGTLQRSLNVIKTGGTVSLIGVLSGLGNVINPDIVLFKNVRLQGISIGSVRMFENMNASSAESGVNSGSGSRPSV